MHTMTVEYKIGESTYCKKFHLTQNDDIKYNISTNVELLVLVGFQKLAMLKMAIEMHNKLDREMS
jgi:hypothetical protein